MPDRLAARESTADAAAGAFARDGYVVVRGLAPPEACAAMAAATPAACPVM